MRKKILIILSVLIVLIYGISVQATSLGKNLDILYNNIKIQLNGNEFVPKTESGDEIEPFINNGTTYLPVRGIAKGFNLDVSWIPEKSTVKLETKQNQYLDELQFTSYETESCQAYLAKNKTENSEHGLKYYFRANSIGHGVNSEQSSAIQKITYNVPKGSQKLKFTISNVHGFANICVTSKNEILYKSPTITGYANGFYGDDFDDMDIEIEISKQKDITFEIELKCDYSGEWTTSSFIQFENACFEK